LPDCLPNTGSYERNWGSECQACTELAKAERIPPVAHEALNWLRTEAGIPWFGVDMNNRHLPLEFGLSKAISLNKGCYRGQEIIARVTYRGHLKRKLGAVVLLHGEPPKQGSEILAGREKVGEITSSAYSPRLQKPLALALLKIDFLNPGSMVEVVGTQGTSPAEIIGLPLS
jgi:folate-binding protein YgfZ